jgi:hypothetical protein
MLDGKFAEAAQTYVALYVDALKRKDFAIGPDLLMGLQYCVAGMAKQASYIRRRGHGAGGVGQAQRED